MGTYSFCLKHVPVSGARSLKWRRLGLVFFGVCGLRFPNTGSLGCKHRHRFLISMWRDHYIAQGVSSAHVLRTLQVLAAQCTCKGASCTEGASLTLVGIAYILQAQLCFLVAAS